MLSSRQDDVSDLTADDLRQPMRALVALEHKQQLLFHQILDRIGVDLHGLVQILENDALVGLVLGQKLIML
jgi:hypothetical protein